MRIASALLLLFPLLLLACSGASSKPEEPVEKPGVVDVYGPPGGLVGVKGEAAAGERPPPPKPRPVSSADCLPGYAGSGGPCHPTDPALVEARGACERDRGSACESYAETVLESLAAEHDRYEGATLEGGDDPRAMKRFAMHLKNKVQGAQRLGAAYQGIAALPEGPWRHHARVQEGTVYDHLADALESLPAPGKLTGEQTELFRQALAEKAAPVREKARSLFVEGVTGAAGIGLQDEIIAWAQRRLRELDAAKAP